MMTSVHSGLLGSASRHVGISGFEPAWWEQDDNIWARTSDAEMEHVFEVQQDQIAQNMQTLLWETCLTGDECRALEASNSCDALDTSRVLDSPDDAVDECPEPKGPSRGGVKRKSPNHCPVSREVLETWFYANKDYPYPDKAVKSEFSNRTGMSVAQVTHWFNNARKRLLVCTSAVRLRGRPHSLRSRCASAGRWVDSGTEFVRRGEHKHDDA